MQSEHSQSQPQNQSTSSIKYGCFKTRPSQKIRYLVVRNLEKLIGITIKDASEFSNTNSTKTKALQELKYTLLIAESKITPFTQQILRSLIKLRQLDLDNIQTLVNDIAQTIGYHVKSSFYIPLMVEMFQSEQVKSSSKNTIILMNLVSYMLKSIENTDEHVQSLVQVLKHYEKIFFENDEGLLAIYSIVEILVKKANKFEQSGMVSVLFSISLNVKATKSIPESQRGEKVQELLTILAKKSGYSSSVELCANEIDPILEKIVKEKQYVNWTKTSKNRFKFDTIVRSCHSEVIKFLPQILQIVEYLINPQSDLEVRMDTLVLLEFMFNLSQLKDSLQPMAQQLLKKILIVSIQWKVGKPQIKIRKAGVINIILLIENQIIQPEQLLECYNELLPPLKNCLNDDWAPELRLASCELVEKMLLHVRQKIDAEQLRELYPLLLERLDDSQNPIRKKITIAINVFFMCQDVKLTESTFEYMVGAIFVHFDDSSEEIQDAILVSLRYAAKINFKIVSTAARQNLKKMKHKGKCQELIQFCEEIEQQRKAETE